MAHSFITFQHPCTMRVETAPVGFSWTALFFGFALLAYHGKWAWSTGLLLITLFLGPLPNLIMCWFYNKNRIHTLWNKGYRVVAIDSEFDRNSLSEELNLPLNSVQLNG